MKTFVAYLLVFFSAIAAGASVYALKNGQWFMLVHLAGSLVVILFVQLVRKNKMIPQNKAVLKFLFYSGITYTVFLLVSGIVLAVIAWMQYRVMTDNEKARMIAGYSGALLLYGCTSLFYFLKNRKAK